MSTKVGERVDELGCLVGLERYLEDLARRDVDGNEEVDAVADDALGDEMQAVEHEGLAASPSWTLSTVGR